MISTNSGSVRNTGTLRWNSGIIAVVTYFRSILLLIITLTGNTTFSDTNLPTGTDTIEFTMKIKGAFVPTFPTYWEIVGDDYDGAVWNFYSVQVHVGTTSSEEVTAFLTNLGA